LLPGPGKRLGVSRGASDRVTAAFQIQEEIMKLRGGFLCAAALAASVLCAGPAMAASSECAGLPTYAQLKEAMEVAAGPGSGITGDNRGFGLEMWGTVVNRDGVVCAVVFTGDTRGSSRVISAQKANTANAFSLNGLALSTANLYRLVQPGESLFGLQESNPVDTAVAYPGPSTRYGQVTDPMVGRKRHWRERRHVVCRSQHRVEGAARAGAQCHAELRQHRLRPHGSPAVPWR
jgi:hypothetical protein